MKRMTENIGTLARKVSVFWTVIFIIAVIVGSFYTVVSISMLISILMMA